MKWRSQRVVGETVLVICALLTSFQLYRIALQELSKVIKFSLEEVIKEDILPDLERDAPAESLDKSDNQLEGGSNQAAQNPAPKEEKVYKYADENTVKGIFNKLTIIMISCVVFPVLVQNIYNLHFTNPGRQLFYEDIESIAITSFLLFMMGYDSYKKTKKIEMKGIKRKQPAGQFNSKDVQIKERAAMAGIPNDLANEAEINEIRQIFKSTHDIKRFRDVLNAMINNPQAMQ